MKKVSPTKNQLNSIYLDFGIKWATIASSRVAGKEVMRIFRTSRFLILPILLFASCEQLSSQTPSPPKPDKGNTRTFNELWNAYPKDGEVTVITDDSELYSMKWLRQDYRIADLVAFVDVKERKLIDHTGDEDCENDQGMGCCAYLLTAQVKEIFKGGVQSKQIEFVITSDATYPKKYFMGEHVVFLQWSEPTFRKKKTLGTLENSTRSIRGNLLVKLRSIVKPTDPIDENDENDPYSIKSIKVSFDESYAVILADVVSFNRYDDEYLGFEPFIIKARVTEVFKGPFSIGQTIEYKVDLLHRPYRAEDLGRQVVYLNVSPPSSTYIQIDNGKKINGKAVEIKRFTNPKRIPYEQVDYTEGRLIHGIVEKLRKISR